jgi:RNA polymerase sigma-70 factor (ECF subfamily)
MIRRSPPSAHPHAASIKNAHARLFLTLHFANPVAATEIQAPSEVAKKVRTRGNGSDLMARLTSTFLKAAGRACDDRATLDDTLARLWSEAQGAWPAVALDADELMRALGARVADGEEPLAALAKLHIADLALAGACVRGDPQALATFEEQLLGRVPAMIARIERRPPVVDEICQVLRARLLVGDGNSPPKLADYSGRGRLASWLRVTANNEALMLLRRRREEPRPSRELRAKAIASRVDPESALFRERHREQFQSALDEALASLEPRDRNLLRAYFVDEMTIDQLSARFRVHRSSAARWVQKAQQRVLDETQRILSERLRLSPSEFASLARLVKSELHLSFGARR